MIPDKEDIITKLTKLAEVAEDMTDRDGAGDISSGGKSEVTTHDYEILCDCLDQLDELPEAPTGGLRGSEKAEYWLTQHKTPPSAVEHATGILKGMLARDGGPAWKDALSLVDADVEHALSVLEDEIPVDEKSD